MPLARYCFFVGGVLLALLFISDAYLPSLPVADRASTELPVIRISSDRKWPERVVYETNLPTNIPALITNTDASVPAAASVVDISPKMQVREAFGQLQPSDAEKLQRPKPKTPAQKLQGKRKIVKNAWRRRWSWWHGNRNLVFLAIGLVSRRLAMLFIQSGPQRDARFGLNDVWLVGWSGNEIEPERFY